MSRPNLFNDDDDDNIDLSAFAPKSAAPPDAPPVDQVRMVTEAARFPSRQPASAPEKRKPRRWRTGRTAQFNCRITPKAFAAFYAIADEHNWTVGATVEQALAALQEKLSR